MGRTLQVKLRLVAAIVFLSATFASANFDYADALSKSILFFEAQRSGKLPSTQRVDWRGYSGLQDGKAQGVDLVGGYYDAGDHVKYGLPMAFTTTMLSWSVVEYGSQMEECEQLGYALDAIKWGTDYFIKAHPEQNVLWGEVGDGPSDHCCWQRPEDMTTPRNAYKIDASNPGSELAGETAAAMAAASIAFRKVDAVYSSTLLEHAKQLFTFADTYRGNYDKSIRVVQGFYTSNSGYGDELLWAALWLYEATGEGAYLEYVVHNADSLGGTGWGMKEFSWDVKYAGLQVLASKVLLEGKGTQYASALGRYQSKAEYFLCACLQKNNGDNIDLTPGGLLYTRQWDNMQYVTSASFLLTVYSDYLSSAHKQLVCPSCSLNPSELLSFAQSQVDYILGNNPRGTSYMVGFGSNYPRQVHHRAASIISIKESSAFVSCLGGFDLWFNRKEYNPNVILGALVGGPDQNDDFADERDNYEQTEPASYNNAPLVGVLARLNGGQGAHKPDTFNPVRPIPHRPPTRPPPSVPLKPRKSPLPSPHPRPPAPRHPVTHPKRPRLPRKPHAPAPYVPGGHRHSSFDIKQTITSSWEHEGKVYTHYRVAVTNISKKKVSHLNLNVQGVFGHLWGLSKLRNGNLYTFPPWLGVLPPGHTFIFVYIQAQPPAKVYVSSFVPVN